MMLLFLCTKKELMAMEEINTIMSMMERNGEKPDFLHFMEEVDKRFKDMDMVWVLADLQDTLRKQKTEEKTVMQSGYS